MKRAPGLARPMRGALIALLVVFAGCLGPQDNPEPTPEAPPFEPFWTERAAMPEPRTEVTCATDGETIWVVGGFTLSNAPTQFFHAYDVATDTWRALNDAPVPIHHTGLVHHQGAVYMLGGYTGLLPFVGLNSVYVYDVAQDIWGLVGTLPAARGAYALAEWEGQVYLAGGAPSQPGPDTYTSTDVLDLESGTFRAGPDLAAPREHMAGAAARGLIVVPGGRLMSLSNFDTTEVLEPDGDAWEAAEPMPTARGGIAAAAWGSKVFVFGGEAAQGTHAEAEAFDVMTGTWETLEPMPHARHGLCAVAVGNAIHVIGGGPEPGLSVSDFHDVLELAPAADA